MPKPLLDNLPSEAQCALATLFFAGFATLGLFPDAGIPLHDGWYHMQRALDIFEGHFFIQGLPELQHTTLKDTYADLHWGYHLLSAPSAYFGIPGFKVFHILAAASVGFMVYRIVAHYHQGRALYLGCLAGAIPLIANRISMPRSIGFGLFLVLLGCYFLVRQKYKLAAGLLFVLVWTYTAWIFLLYAFFVWALARYITEKKVETKLLLYGTGAVALAFVVNPFFPSNFVVTWQQTISFILIDIPVGNEWSPTQPKQYRWLLPLAIVGAAFGSKTETLNRDNLFWGILAITFVGLTFSTVRGMTYTAPMIAIFIGSLNVSMPDHQRVFLRRLAMIFVVLFGFSTYINTASLSKSQPLRTLDACIPDVRETFEADAKLFNPRWDDFPRLYYETDHLYSTGLDPRFTYLAGKQIYENTIQLHDKSDPISVLKEWKIDGVVSRRENDSEELKEKLVEAGATLVGSYEGCYVIDI